MSGSAAIRTVSTGAFELDTSMPIYEYRCQDCRKVQSFLTLRIGAELDPVCQSCGSRRLTRLISRVSVTQSEEARLERLADPSRWGGLDENDPASVARFAKTMGEAMGEDVGDIDEMMDEGAVDDGLDGESAGSGIA